MFCSCPSTEHKSVRRSSDSGRSNTLQSYPLVLTSMDSGLYNNTQDQNGQTPIPVPHPPLRGRLRRPCNPARAEVGASRGPRFSIPVSATVTFSSKRSVYVPRNLTATRRRISRLGISSSHITLLCDVGPCTGARHCVG